MAHVFVSIDRDAPYEKVYLYNASGSKVRQVLWGDWLTLAEPEDLTDGQKNSDTWLWVRWSWSSEDPAKRQLLKVKRAYTHSARPLEMIFVDVGIGDGAVLISPERGQGEDAAARGTQERIIVIDAGKTEHMREFLDSRFKAYRRGFNFHAAVISHPDYDHYYGFNRILSTSKITFDHVYHNGIVELNSEETFDRLGGTQQADNGVSYLKTLITDDATMRATFDPSKDRNNKFAKVIEKGITKGNVGSFDMLGVNFGASEDGRYWMPGFAPSDGWPYTIEVLGPWVEYPFADGTPRLRTFGDTGKTKNGHSVLLRLVYGHFAVLFGGDLNTPSERFLLQKLAGLDHWPATKDDREAMVAEARKRLSSHVMKSCHHGASDVTDEFIQAVQPAAFVISSGDQDASYVHPRPDLLGRLGRLGFGNAPVLLSTELQRSTRDIDNTDLVRSLKKKITKLVSDTPDDGQDAADFEAERSADLAKLLESFEKLAVPSVAVDGAIYVKTDGDLLMTAFKKETDKVKERWFYYAYRIVGEGMLELIEQD